MPSFFKEIKEFYGTGIRNEENQTLEEFLEGYDPYKYKGPYVTADIVVLKESKEKTNVGFKLLMIQRKNHPCIGYWALPGGFAEIHEDLIESAKRELREETGLTSVPLEQLYTWGDEKRDPRARIITVSYLAYIENEVEIKAGDDARDAAWVDINLKLLHSEVIQENGRKRRVERYELSLQSVENEINSKAIVCVSKNLNTVLKELRYTIEENQQIAFDHAKIITQALLSLQ